MTETRQDLRVRKTQQALATAMLSLLDSASFSRITVNDICTEALVSRSAFYVHFQDKYDLLHFCLEKLSDRIFAGYEEVSHEEVSFEGRLKEVLEAFQSNKRVLLHMIGTDLDVELAEMIRGSFQKDMQRVMKLRNITPEIYARHQDLVTVYFTAGITHTILYWLSKDTPDSVDDMVLCFSQFLAPLSKPGLFFEHTQDAMPDHVNSME